MPLLFSYTWISERIVSARTGSAGLFPCQDGLPRRYATVFSVYFFSVFSLP